MAQRKFNIFERTSGTEFSEKVLSKSSKYRMQRDGTIVEYDETVMAALRATALAALDADLAGLVITQEQYDTQLIALNTQYNALEQVSADALGDELVFTGSKSDIRKGEMAERNISVLYNTKADVNALRYDIGLFSPNEQPLAETIMAFVSPVALRIGETLSTAQGTQVSWEGTVAADFDIAVKVNGIFKGYIRIKPDTSYEITVVGAFNLNQGDVLQYVTPETFEPDLTNLSITVAANQINK